MTYYIKSNVLDILKEIPEHVKLVAAAKTRTPEEIREAVDAGIYAVGENYIQEALKAHSALGKGIKWHFIGHLQKNKVKQAVQIFDVIETIDNVSLAKEIDKRCAAINKVMSVFIEVNSGREPQKNGVYPEDVQKLATEIAACSNIKVNGLMTMGPLTGDPEDARPYFRETRRVFEEIKSLNIPGVEMESLSMGMTNSYKIAIEEGANIVRIGTKIFGERE